MIIDGEIVGGRAVRYFDYVNAIGQGELVTRSDMALRMGASYSAVMYNLERAVLEGALNKAYGYATENQPGWLYALPETMPRLGGIDE